MILGLLGLILACVGLIALVVVHDRFTLGRILLVGASLILTPLFGYVMSLRGRGRRESRRRAIARQAALQAELEHLVTPEAIRATADGDGDGLTVDSERLTEDGDVKRET